MDRLRGIYGPAYGTPTDPAVPGVSPLAAHPEPLALVGSAARLTSDTARNIRRAGQGEGAWQDDAWGVRDAVGEHWFITDTVGKLAGQARFYVGYLNDDPHEPPTPIEDPATAGLLDRLGPRSYLAQMVHRSTVGFLVVGEAYLLGVPSEYLPEDTRSEMEDPDGVEWRITSSSEISSIREGTLQLRLGEGANMVVELPDDETVTLIRMWFPHPRWAWVADSPTRASLPVLRELVGLTMHISAQVDSRLAGAGILVVPQSVERAARRQAGLPDGPVVVDGVVQDEDPFTDSLIAAMTTPINDRAAASAVVPLVVTVPDEVAAKGAVQHLTFSTPLDGEARQLREEAIRRLALGMSAPPELLLGMGDSNHWSAWLVNEDNIGTHVEPHPAMWADTLTTQWLRPLLERADELGLAPVDCDGNPVPMDRIVVWYSVAHMVMRPNRVQEAEALYDRGALSDNALRDVAGFGEGDAPPEDDLPRAASLAFEMVTKTPSLASSPGLGALVQQIQAILDGDYSGAAAVAGATAGTGSTPSEGEPPATAGEGQAVSDGGAVPSTSGEAPAATAPTGIGG
jgi:hypothetical protein